MIDESPDSSHLDALEDLKRHPGYALLCAAIQTELDRKRLYLESPLKPPDTSFARGSVSALRLVLQLPDILHDELQKTLEQENKR